MRAAWIFAQRLEKPLPEGHYACDLSLLMEDPEDRSLMEKVGTMVKVACPRFLIHSL